MRRFPSFSAIVEGENARLTGAERATRTLRTLISQTAELADQIDGRPELIILFEKEAVPREVVEKAVEAACGSGSALEVRLHATEGSDYYGQKNEGAQLATRDYLLFLDSDVVPEAGWLRALLGSLQPGVGVVAGSTYVDTDSFLGRVFGLFWFFPVRSSVDGLKEVGFFYANNVIFRRDLFLAYRYPDLPLYRGQCDFLGKKLRSNGVRLFLQTGARVAHPPPSPRHFIHRALSEGYDAIIRKRIAGKPTEMDRAELRRQLDHVRTRVNNRAQLTNAGRREVAAALALGRAYCLLRFAGQRWALRSPEGAQRALGIRSLPLPSAGDWGQPQQTASSRLKETADVR